jgi:hypothetical protein
MRVAYNPPTNCLRRARIGPKATQQLRYTQEKSYLFLPSSLLFTWRMRQCGTHISMFWNFKRREDKFFNNRWDTVSRIRHADVQSEAQSLYECKALSEWPQGQRFHTRWLTWAPIIQGGQPCLLRRLRSLDTRIGSNLHQ